MHIHLSFLHFLTRCGQDLSQNLREDTKGDLSKIRQGPPLVVGYLEFEKNFATVWIGEKVRRDRAKPLLATELPTSLETALE